MVLCLIHLCIVIRNLCFHSSGFLSLFQLSNYFLKGTDNFHSIFFIQRLWRIKLKLSMFQRSQTLMTTSQKISARFLRSLNPWRKYIPRCERYARILNNLHFGHPCIIVSNSVHFWLSRTKIRRKTWNWTRQKKQVQMKKMKKNKMQSKKGMSNKKKKVNIIFHVTYVVPIYLNKTYICCCERHADIDNHFSIFSCKKE